MKLSNVIFVIIVGIKEYIVEVFILIFHQPGLAFALENAVRLCYSASWFSLVVQTLLLNHENELLQNRLELLTILVKVKPTK